MVKLIECPRDAMQGLHDFIPTEVKIDYLNTLLQVGFHTLDFGSFVSTKAIPQMRDTAGVLQGLNLGASETKLLAIIANLKGAEQACQHEQISLLGYPLSLSETFQQRNTNRGIADALQDVKRIQELCRQHNKTLVVYLSMGFGNPYGEDWSPETVAGFTKKLDDLQVSIIALSDTIGVSDPENISDLFSTLIPAYPHIEFGAHLHTNPNTWEEKVAAAYDAGCRRFDGALKGFGGCPMAKDELVGNMPTENMIRYFDKIGVDLKLDRFQLETALQKAVSVFPA